MNVGQCLSSELGIRIMQETTLGTRWCSQKRAKRGRRRRVISHPETQVEARGSLEVLLALMILLNAAELLNLLSPILVAITITVPVPTLTLWLLTLTYILMRQTHTRHKRILTR